MSNPKHLNRHCSRCGRELPSGSSIVICTLCALQEAAAGAEPATEQAPIKSADLKADEVGADVQTAGFGQQIGRFKIPEKVGEGGWGEVYVAEQQEPIYRRVAIKVIKLGMDILEGTIGPSNYRE
ncbi:MAG: hypothetical protein AB9869_31705 [Verrucomicrobiia bacterium]